MNTYRLYFLADVDDSNPKRFSTDRDLFPGNVIQLPETGFYHLITRLHKQKTGIRLDLSESAQTADDARLIAAQLGHFSID